ncbi:Cox15p PWA37_002037 [Arxiozyma heterogenica]|uniref:Cox15p n=1 Tax=Arxiozyma heterogenica TaxID=278026 RepID=UPI002F18E94C
MFRNLLFDTVKVSKFSNPRCIRNNLLNRTKLVSQNVRCMSTKITNNFTTELWNHTNNVFLKRSDLYKYTTTATTTTMNITRSFSSTCHNSKSDSSSSATSTTTNIRTSSNQVAYWLIGTSGLVFGIVILGGLTRLTESGLSITEWKPVTGSLPPLSQEEWEEEFRKYKSSPEFQQLNSHINLDEFKFIFFMEWIHRLWGRAIGLVFVIPAIYFAARKRTSPHVNKRLFYLCSLLGLQGFVGWWMVKSGLDQEQLNERKSKPTVSQYRLTTHLGTAFILYLGMLWTGLDILKENKWLKNPEKCIELFKKLDSSKLGPLRKMSIFLLGLSFITAMSGGMVAGLDAGLIYNTWPKMGENWFPSKRELMDPNFTRRDDQKDLWWRNLLENPTTVQLVHRTFATLAFCAVLYVHMYAIKKKPLIPRNSQMTLHALMGVVTLQAFLGITTILFTVPIHLASTHQAGALALVTVSLMFMNQLRKPRMQIKNVINSSMAARLKHQANGNVGKRIVTETFNLVK